MLSTTESLVSSGPVFHLEMLNSRVTALVLLQKVVGISEKAAEIARIVRKAYWKNSANGFIETESKSAVDITDFKTLADVLIQAVITRELNQAVSFSWILVNFSEPITESNYYQTQTAHHTLLLFTTPEGLEDAT